MDLVLAVLECKMEPILLHQEQQQQIQGMVALVVHPMTEQMLQAVLVVQDTVKLVIGVNNGKTLRIY
jgi:hypothetical protein